MVVVVATNLSSDEQREEQHHQAWGQAHQQNDQIRGCIRLQFDISFHCNTSLRTIRRKRTRKVSILKLSGYIFVTTE
jgi:hypothetical protein